MKTLLITGATGLVGRELIKNLHKKKYQIIVSTRSTSKASFLREFYPNITFVNSNTLNQDFFEAKDIDIILNLAANTNKHAEAIELVEPNLYFPLKLISFIKKTQKTNFININSTFYENENNRYSQSKNSLKEFLKLEDLNIFNFNVDNIYGEYDSSKRFINMMAQRLYNNEGIIELTSCKQTRDFVHVEDVVNLLKLAIEKITSKKYGFMDFDIGSGEAVQLRAIMLKLKEITKSSSHLSFGKIFYDDSNEKVLKSKINIDPTKNYFNWIPLKKIFSELGSTILHIKDENK